MQSHVLHIYFLAAPDLLGVPSVVPLAATHPDVVKMALRMKKLANDICDRLGGRTIHPNRLVPGGFTRLPSLADLEWIRDMLVKQMVPDAKASLALLKSLLPKFPDFRAGDRIHRASSHEKEYAFYDGDDRLHGHGASPRGRLPLRDQRVRRAAFHLQALPPRALLLLRRRAGPVQQQLSALLNPLAKSAAAELGLKPVVKNPFLNTAVQLVETVHVVEESLEAARRSSWSGGSRKRSPRCRRGCAKAAARRPPRCRAASSSTTTPTTTAARW